MKLLAFALLLVASQAWGATWYVRPVADCPNNGDGTAYACAASAGTTGARRGLNNVQWGAGNVGAGDTLRVCSTSTSPFVAADADLAAGLLSVDQSGVIVDGDCSASGGSSIAYFEGGGTFDTAVRCDSPNCVGQTWKNMRASNFDVRGFYFRNGFSFIAAGNFAGVNLQCESILGLDAATPACVQGWGANSSITASSSIRTTDDAFHWQGANFSLTESYCKDPNYASATNGGDCVQVANDPDNAYIARNVFDKSATVSIGGATGKQAVALTNPGSANNATVEDNVLLLPYTGNSTYEAKVLYSAVPGTVVRRNYVKGGYFGLFLEGAGSTAISNIVVDPEYQGIATSSAVSSGTHSILNNSVYGHGTTCFDLSGGASVTVNAYNNLALGCSIGYNKGASNTVTQSNNAGFANTTNSFIGALAVTANPQLVDGLTPTTAEGFKLKSTSPLRRAGKDLNIGNVQDYNNRAFLHPPSIGAHEVYNSRGTEFTDRTTVTDR